MNRYLPIALLCAATGWMAPAAAEDIYRCGDSYSQQPCAGGKLVAASDTRSASQKAQTDQATKRDAKSADAMERARLKEEGKPAPVGMPLAKPQEVAQETKKPVAVDKAKKPAHFTAVSPKKPGDGPTKKKKKQGKKKDA